MADIGKMLPHAVGNINGMQCDAKCFAELNSIILCMLRRSEAWHCYSVNKMPVNAHKVTGLRADKQRKA